MKNTNVKYLKDYSIRKVGEDTLITYLPSRDIDNANYLMLLNKDVKIFERDDNEEFTNLVHCSTETCTFMRKLQLSRIS